MRLSDEQIKKYGAYLYIQVATDKNNPNEMAHTVYFTNFFRSSKPLYLDESDLTLPCFQIITMGGGYISGEVYRSDFVIEDNARCIITSQASAKTYKAVDGKSAQQHTNITIGKNSVLEYISDNIIVYENGKYEQYNVFHMDSSATFIYTECFGPGWSPHGATLSYEKMYLNTKIYYDNRLVLFDNLKFQPSLNDESAFGIMSGYDYCGTMIVIDQHVSEEDVIVVRDRIKALAESDDEFKFDFEFGVSYMDVPGLGIRVLAQKYYEVEKINAVAHAYFREKLFNKKPLKLRKM